MENTKSRSLRALIVLEKLSGMSHPQTLSQLAQRTQLPKTSLMRMLNTLEEAGYVTRMPSALGYVTGPRAHQLALSVLESPQFLRACRNILGKLVAITGETCNLNALADDAVHYLIRVESREQLRLQLHMDVGAKVPLHCTASGKLFLAFTPRHHQAKILDRIELTAVTPKTIVQRDVLQLELDRTRAQGIGIDNEEFVRGMVAVAVPVKDQRENVIAVLACHAPTAEASLKKLLGFVEPMRHAAAELSELLSQSVA